MGKKAAALILLLAQLILLNGCWDIQDLSDISIPIVGGYDLPKNKARGKSQVEVTGLLPNLDPEAREKARVEKITAETVGETREIRDTLTPDTYMVGMTQVAIYGEELARQGLSEVTDGLLRDSSNLKRTIPIAVVDGRADELLSFNTKDYTNLGVYLLGLLRHAHHECYMPTATIGDFVIESGTAGKNPVLPLLKVTGGHVELVGSGIFRKERLIAKIGRQETRAMMLLRGMKSYGRLPFKIIREEKLIDQGTVQMINNRKVRVQRQGNQYNFIIDINLTGSILEHTRRESFVKHESNKKEIEQAVAGQILGDCRRLVGQMQNRWEVDCIDISKYALARWRNELQKRVDEKDFIKNAAIIVRVKVDLKNIGERT